MLPEMIPQLNKQKTNCRNNLKALNDDNPGTICNSKKI